MTKNKLIRNTLLITCSLILATPKVYAAAHFEQPSSKALWVWDTHSLVDDPSKWGDFFQFCEKKKISHLWIQILLTQPNHPVDGVETAQQVASQNLFRQFNQTAHKKGFQVEALDGAPEYALEGNHPEALNVVRTIIDFNQHSAAAERFDGIHFDIEPYLLVGWHDPERRTEILTEYLDLLMETKTLMGHQSGLRLTVDIPYWWHQKEPKIGIPNAEVMFHGSLKAVTFHVIDLVDCIAIMDYRNHADGGDGIIAHGKEIIEYANKTHGARVYLAIETFSEEPREVWFTSGITIEELKARNNPKRNKLLKQSHIQSSKLCAFQTGHLLHVGLEFPKTGIPETSGAFTQSMVELGQIFGTEDRSQNPEEREKILSDQSTALATQGEWSNVTLRPIIDLENSITYLGFQATRSMPLKTTFAGRTLDQIEAETKLVEKTFGKSKQFNGVAIHHYKSYRLLASHVNSSESKKL